MTCVRCPNPGTRHEWTVRGAVVPMRFSSGEPAALCDACWEVYSELLSIENAMLASGLSRAEINMFLKQRIRALASGPRQATG